MADLQRTGIDRLAGLLRAAVERERIAGTNGAGLSAAAATALQGVAPEQRKTLPAELEQLLPQPAAAEPREAAPAALGSGAGMQELQRARAALELKLQSEAARIRDLEAKLKKEQDDHKQAIETLQLQHGRLNDLQAERTKLLADVSRVEGQLRQQISENEQLALKLDKLKGSRQSLGDQTVELTEQINALKAENGQLRERVEAALQERDKNVAAAQRETTAAEAQTADAAFAAIWAELAKEIPDIFVPTHVANRETFDQMAAVMIELVRAFATIEQHVLQMLRDLKVVQNEKDKLNHFLLMLKKNPDFASTMRECIVSGKRISNLAQLLRVLQAWARAFGSGLYKTVVKSPEIVGQQMNYKSWPLKTSFTLNEDAAIGKYIKETAAKAIPELVGTELRKQANDMAYRDYDVIVRTR